MTVLYGPTNTALPDGTILPPLKVFLPSANIGDTTTISWSSTVQGTPNSNGWDIRVFNHANVQPASHDQPAPPQSGGSFTYTFTAADSAPYWLLAVGGGCSGCQMTVNALEIQFSGTVSLCAYGGQPNPGAPLQYAVTAALIDLVVTGALIVTGQVAWIPYVETALAAIEGSIPLAIDCSVVPPGNGPPLDLTNPASVSPTALDAWFRTAAWNYFCECTPAPPGMPAPVPPTPPAIITPPGTSNPPPPLTCNNTDLCTYLLQISAAIAGVQTKLNSIQQEVIEIQRYGVPFAYVAGIAHSGLSGSGTFTIARAVGFQVILTALPPLKTLPGDPIYLWDVGWMAISDPSGMLGEQRITRQSMTWMPRDVQIATQFSYFLNPGVVMSVVPLLAEP